MFFALVCVLTNKYYFTAMLLRRLYFYTATIHQWKPLIRDLCFEQVILDSLHFLHKKECLKVYGFVIMPNHIHLIWQLLKANGKKSPVASLMKFTAHRFEEELRRKNPDALQQFQVQEKSRRYRFWQSNADWFWLNYIPTIDQKLHYIHYNPLQDRWKLCKTASDYPFSSARFYETGENRFGFLHHYSEFVESDLWMAD